MILQFKSLWLRFEKNKKKIASSYIFLLNCFNPGAGCCCEHVVGARAFIIHFSPMCRGGKKRKKEKKRYGVEYHLVGFPAIGPSISSWIGYRPCPLDRVQRDEEPWLRQEPFVPNLTPVSGEIHTSLHSDLFSTVVGPDGLIALVTGFKGESWARERWFVKVSVTTGRDPLFRFFYPELFTHLIGH